MGNLVEWLMPEYANGYVLLVSLDGKRGFPFARKAVENPGESERVVDLGTEDDYSAHDLKRLVRDFKLHMRANPDLADEIGYKPTRKVLQPRIARLPIEQRASVENLDSAIRDAYLDPRKAEADDLILAFLARENAWVGVPQEQHLAVEAELQRLLRDGELWSGGRLHLYDTEGLTLTELTARRKRALKNCEKLWSKFPEAFLEHGETEALERWLQQFDRDEMLELAVVAWYKCPSPAGREKVLAGSADQALRS
jgi:hypothetical protein